MSKATPPIHIPVPGHLVCRDGWYEFTFPCFEENAELVVVPNPTQKRVRLFFGTYTIPCNFTPAERDRILPRLHWFTPPPFSATRFFELPDPDEAKFQFHPELFEQRSRASELLAAADIVMFSDFASIDLVHERYGLEVGGIAEKATLDRVAGALQTGFPHWHFTKACLCDKDRDPGWRYSIFMLPNPRPGCC